jgi:formylglycine-generating enzyme required for sulfatase activity
MGWPQATDYFEAIQDPQACFADADLRQGEPAVNALGLPLPRSGNFADVYEIRCPGDRGNWAVKCFTREVPGLRERYRAIGAHLAQAGLPFMVEFQYLDEGIRIRGRWYPVVKMRWVEGLTLNEFVRRHVDKPQILNTLADLWVRLAQALRRAGAAHGDLQHGNVLLVTANRANTLSIKLIDYDGMYVPELADRKSGEVGHPSYQHPQRLREGLYQAEMDRFSHLVIYFALRVVAEVGRRLWDRYDNGDNLLFRESDLQAPAVSPLFHELWQRPACPARTLAARLLLASLGPFEDVPLLQDLVSGGRVAPLSAEQESQVKQLLVGGSNRVRRLPRIQPSATAPAGRKKALDKWWESSPASVGDSDWPPVRWGWSAPFQRPSPNDPAKKGRFLTRPHAIVAMCILIFLPIFFGFIHLQDRLNRIGSQRVLHMIGAIPDTSVVVGRSTTVPVKVWRRNSIASLQLEVKDLPPGVHCRPSLVISLPLGSSNASFVDHWNLELTADLTAAPADQMVLVCVAGSAVENGTRFRLVVRTSVEKPITEQHVSQKPVTQKPITNGMGMELVLVSRGKFLMGSVDDDLQSYPNEKPQHEVEITKDFYLGKYEVTRGQFRRFVKGTIYRTEAEKAKDAPTWQDTPFGQTDAHPVVNVTWNDAMAFCEWLSVKEGQKYRLPTEAEWEYSCRATTTTRFFSGDGLDGLAEVANFGRKHGFTTMPVGSFKANAFGFYDMHGNVWEWCQDVYDEDYYKNSPKEDPQGPDGAADAFRVIRGGSYYYPARDCRCANRGRYARSYRDYNVGFRVVLVR